MPDKPRVNLRKEFTKGLLLENPVLRLMLGTCPALAVTTTTKNGLGMGLAATFVLLGANLVISLLRNIIPEKVRIPSFITIIAGFVTIVQLLMQSFLPALNESLGIFIPLITVNCVILARAEVFASKHAVVPSIVDGLGMGAGFTAALVLMGTIREVIGNGTFFDISLPMLQTGGYIEPMLIMILPPGGFFAYAILIAISQWLTEKTQKKEFADADVCAGAISDKTACLLCGGCSFGRSSQLDKVQQDEEIRRMAKKSMTPDEGIDQRGPSK
jgi:Na+-translocating ferredoxin:NAD+ oxidoreductase subunit E